MELTVIEKLNASVLVTGEDLQFLTENSEAFEKRFRTRSLFRSKTEMIGGVLNDIEHPTSDSKYWQAIGEQNVHLTELINLNYESGKLQADNELLEAEIEELVEEQLKANSVQAKIIAAKVKKKKIELSQGKFNLTQQLKTAQERMREVRTWEPIIKELETQLKYGDEDFGLHHAERYVLRYKAKLSQSGLAPDIAENYAYNLHGYANAYNKEHAAELPMAEAQRPIAIEKDGVIKTIETPIDKSKSNQIDFKSMEEAASTDPIVKRYFEHRVRRIMVATPHRLETDSNCTNFNSIQPPAGVSTMLFSPYGYTVADARNICVEKIIQSEGDYLLFVDDDVILPKGAVIQLLNHNVDVVAGIYYRKYTPLETCSMHYNKDGSPSSINDYQIGDLIPDTLVAGCGCMLIKVEALKKMEAPLFKTVTIQDRPAMTEDSYFCQKLRDSGMSVLTDTGIQCVHVDKENGIFYGHPEIVDMDKNEIKEKHRQHYAV
jgi:hypothetical protein